MGRLPPITTRLLVISPHDIPWLVLFKFSAETTASRAGMQDFVDDRVPKGKISFSVATGVQSSLNRWQFALKASLPNRPQLWWLVACGAGIARERALQQNCWKRHHHWLYLLETQFYCNYVWPAEAKRFPVRPNDNLHLLRLEARRKLTQDQRLDVDGVR